MPKRWDIWLIVVLWIAVAAGSIFFVKFDECEQQSKYGLVSHYSPFEGCVFYIDDTSEDIKIRD